MNTPFYKPRPWLGHHFTCRHCHTPYTASIGWQKYCSPRCRLHARRKRTALEAAWQRLMNTLE